MNRALCVLVPTAFLLGLSGCNNVVSNEPWFTAADAQGAPELRDGLWVKIGDDHCRVKLEKPAERWPECANSFYVRGGEWLTMNWDDTDGRKRLFEGWTSLSPILAAGNPVILQLDEGSEPQASPSDPDEIVIGDEEPYWRYSYGAVRPTELDGQGRVVAFELWVVQCGPSPQRELKAGVEYPLLSLMEGYVTDRPFPGLTVVGERCTAESVDALRRAAGANRDLGQVARWVRDGWH